LADLGWSTWRKVGGGGARVTLGRLPYARLPEELPPHGYKPVSPPSGSQEPRSLILFRNVEMATQVLESDA